MKKLLMALVISTFLPLNIFAYSENVILGGKNIGITIKSDGVMVVGFYEVDGKYIGKESILIGDIIISIDGVEVNSINEMSDAINENIKDNKVTAIVNRDGKEISVELTLVKDSDVYKTGLYVKDKVTGLGTLSYIDPETKIYGALGHEIISSDSEDRVLISGGNIYDSVVTGIDRSTNGSVGSKNAVIDFNTSIGDVDDNTGFGIFGEYTADISNNNLIEVADFGEIKLGKAQIVTTLDGEKVGYYDIEITKLSDTINTNKSINFEITDEKLISATGGVVQGMSGSPIIQNNKIIGAVTYVIVDDVKSGYGVFIRTMLEEGEN